MNFSARDRLRLLAGGSALILTACGGGGGASPATVAAPPPTPPIPPTTYTPVTGLYRDTFRNNFKVGTAIRTDDINANRPDLDIIKTQFNSVTSEYEMKPEFLAPTEGTYDFTAADQIVDFAIANDLEVRGHTLLWHVSTPDYFFEGTRAEIKARLEKYVTDVVNHFKDRVKTWDVVNEVITDDSSAATAPYRNSNWYQAVGGPEFIDWAFNAARAADPDAQLFINEYNTELSGKRDRLVTVVSDLVDRGIPVDGVGHQMHIQLSTPPQDVLAAIDAVDNMFAGLENHVTELDISIYSDPGSCFANQTGCAADVGNAPPDASLIEHAQNYREIYNGLVARSTVTSVTTWGVADGESWLNNYPINRTNYPLLFDRNYDAKRAFRAITDSGFVIQ